MVGLHEEKILNSWSIKERSVDKQWFGRVDCEFGRTSEPVKVDKINVNELRSQLSGEARKNKSLFAQNLELKGKLKSHFPLDKVYQPTKALESNEQLKSVEKSISAVRKQLITGEGLGNTKDVEQIHLENIELLAQMTPEQIVAEQAKLVQQLDPKLVAFIRRRGKDITDDSTSTNSQFSVDQENRPKIEY